MKSCIKCGTSLDDYVLICPKCGTKQDRISKLQTNKKGKFRTLFFTFLLWLCFWPIMIIIVTAKSKKLHFWAKALILGVYFSVLILPAFILGLSTATETGANSSISITSNTTSVPEFFSDVLHDETLRLNFLNACQEIGMDPSEISELNPVDDWVGGTRYSFKYKSLACRLYCNTDSTVNCIKLGNDIDVYKQGFEPYQITDYIVDTDIAVELQALSEEQVKAQLKYPTTANFPWENWAYGRDHDLYSVSNTVLAQNAFGNEEELIFKLIYQVKDTSFRLIYFQLDGSCLVDNMSSTSRPDRQAIDTSATGKASTTDEIVLMEGQTGDYGKSIDIDGASYINYYVPSGSYKVTSNVNWCKLYVASNNYFINNEGYTENEIIEALEFSSLGETQSISIEEGQHIELTLSAKVTLTPEKQN